MFILRKIKSNYYFFRALLLLRSPRYKQSIEYFMKALNYSNDFKYSIYQCHKYIGIAYCLDNDFLRAKKYLLIAQSIAEKNNNDPELFAHLGLVYDSENELTKAKDLYRLALKNFKENDFVHFDYVKSRLNLISELEEKG